MISNSMISDAVTKALSISTIIEVLRTSQTDVSAEWSTLAKSGVNHKQDEERQFHPRACALLGIGLEPYPFRAPVRVNGETRLHTLHILLPHELFSHLFNWNKDAWVEVFFGNHPHDPIEFWDHIARWSPTWWQKHLLRTTILSDKASWAPLKLFGDDVAINKERDRNVLVKEWSSLLCTNETWFNHLLALCIRKEWILTKTTDVLAMKILVWSLNIITTGHWPMVDWDGGAFKNGYRKQQRGKPLTPGDTVYRGVVVLYNARPHVGLLSMCVVLCVCMCVWLGEEGGHSEIEDVRCVRPLGKLV